MGLQEWARGKGIFARGAWQNADQLYATINPATSESLVEVAEAGPADVDHAVQSAKAAFEHWRRVPARERGNLVRAIGQRLLEHADDIAKIEALDCGNPLRACKDDVVIAATMLDYLGGLALEVRGETIPTDGALNFTLRDPYGVVGRIIAFNHPTLFTARALAAPLVAGNTVVIKPSPHTPLASIRVMELIDGILPHGVINLVTGGNSAAEALVKHPDVWRIALTGSVSAALAVTRAAAQSQIKTLSFELGGKNPMIVLPDADHEAVARSAIAGMNFTSSAGQSCGSTSRLFIHASIHDKVVECLRALIGEIRLGDPLDEGSDMGPLVSADQQAKSGKYVGIAREQGARVMIGGSKGGGALSQGYFFEPTLIADVEAQHRIANEEIFGPVVSALRWTDAEQLLNSVNGSLYGLTASVWTNNLRDALKWSRDVQAGYVWINNSSQHPLGAPFGGVKNSGNGREECFEEILSYTQLKNVNIRVA